MHQNCRIGKLGNSIVRSREAFATTIDKGNPVRQAKGRTEVYHGTLTREEIKIFISGAIKLWDINKQGKPKPYQ